MNKTNHIYNWQTASVDPIVGSTFFSKAVELIDGAKQSVSICIFTARYYRGQSRNPINALFDALRRAAQRGVSVRILLNQNFYDTQADKHNRFIAQYFKARNFEAAMGGKSTRIHAKLILIDGRITVIGSHNYSARAHKTNFETSVIIKSHATTEFFINEFNRLWKSRTLIPGKISE
jgi:phosphatidylserine/phosphatidylglycerophosphate/cardiolipin synthase-like enzyme